MNMSNSARDYEFRAQSIKRLYRLIKIGTGEVFHISVSNPHQKRIVTDECIDQAHKTIENLEKQQLESIYNK